MSLNADVLLGEIESHLSLVASDDLAFVTTTAAEFTDDPRRATRHLVHVSALEQDCERCGGPAAHKLAETVGRDIGAFCTYLCCVHFCDVVRAVCGRELDDDEDA